MRAQTFSELVKRELCLKTYALQPMQTLLRAFLLNAAKIKTDRGQTYWEVRTGFAFIADFIVTHLKTLYDIKLYEPATIRPPRSNQRVWHVRFVANFTQLENDLQLNVSPNGQEMDETTAQAFLIGAFLSGGSLSAPQKGNYHFEMHGINAAYLEIIGSILERQNVIWKTKIIARRGHYVFYVKRAEAIADILRMMDASQTMFEYEDLRIARDLKNNLRRMQNLDQSNRLRAATNASNAADIAVWLCKSPGFDCLPAKLQLYCRVRKKHATASLSAIAAYMAQTTGKPYSRAAIWRLEQAAHSVFNKQQAKQNKSPAFRNR